jgi:hypothetical protein
VLATFLVLKLRGLKDRLGEVRLTFFLGGMERT